MGVANCFIPLGVYFGDFPFWNKARNAYILYVWMRLAGRIAHKITQKRVDESLNRDFFLFGRGVADQSPMILRAIHQAKNRIT